jgi:TRAP-type C4-dicarboxylate transport system substrate-binding protein
MARVGTKVFVLIFSRKFLQKLTSFLQNICDENTKLARKFLRKLFAKTQQ